MCMCVKILKKKTMTLKGNKVGRGEISGKDLRQEKEVVQLY